MNSEVGMRKWEKTTEKGSAHSIMIYARDERPDDRKQMTENKILNLRKYSDSAVS